MFGQLVLQDIASLQRVCAVTVTQNRSAASTSDSVIGEPMTPGPSFPVGRLRALDEDGLALKHLSLQIHVSTLGDGGMMGPIEAFSFKFSRDTGASE